MEIEFFGLTDKGLKRESNQDYFDIVKDKYNNYFLVVCDGIGGSNAGDVASKEVCLQIEKDFVKNRIHRKLIDNASNIKKNIESANAHVLDLARSKPEYHGMGTTLTGIYISNIGNLVANVGDSRVYGVNNEKIVQLTDDDTLVNEMYKRGEITKEEMLSNPSRHYLTKAIGVSKYIEPKVYEVSHFDYYLICSDGLHGYVDENKIKEIILSDDSLENKCKALINCSLEIGGYDNVTVILCKVCQK